MGFHGLRFRPVRVQWWLIGLLRLDPGAGIEARPKPAKEAFQCGAESRELPEPLPERLYQDWLHLVQPIEIPILYGPAYRYALRAIADGKPYRDSGRAGRRHRKADKPDGEDISGAGPLSWDPTAYRLIGL